MEQYITEERTTDRISKKTNECEVFETRESEKKIQHIKWKLTNTISTYKCKDRSNTLLKKTI